MPRTDIDDNRSLSRLQGIDLREHGDSNTALDCVNVHLNNASRLTNFPPPTKVRSGAYTFACESKDPAGQEFTLNIDGSIGTPGITFQEAYNNGQQVKLTGANLQGNCQVILVNEDGHCLESGLDFNVFAGPDGSLILDLLWSEYGSFTTVVVRNAYGSTSVAVDVTVRENNVLYFSGGSFKMGIDPKSLALCIWQKKSGAWQKIIGWFDTGMRPWIESAERRVDVECMDFTDGVGHWSLFVNGATTSSLSLRLGHCIAPEVTSISQLVTASIFEEAWGLTSGRFIDPSVEYTHQTSYAFGKYDSYRLYFSVGAEGVCLALQGKSDYTQPTYDITFRQWSFS